MFLLGPRSCAWTRVRLLQKGAEVDHRILDLRFSQFAFERLHLPMPLLVALIISA